jgi:hypothetical protein
MVMAGALQPGSLSPASIALAGALQQWRPWNGTVRWLDSDHS